MASLSSLPPELLQLIAYETHILTPADVRSLCLTCSSLNYALHGDGNEHDEAQHQSLCGLSACLASAWPRAAALALLSEINHVKFLK